MLSDERRFVNRERWIGLTILGLAVLCRLPALTESLWYDEVYYSSDKLLSPEWKRWVFGDVHPPLYALLMRVWVWIVPESEFSLRLPSLTFGLLGVLLIWYMGRRWFGETTGVWAGIFAATNPTHIWYSQENKTNCFSTTLLALVMVLASRWKERPSCGNALGLVVVSLAALSSHTFAVPFLISVGLWLWLASWRSPQHRATLITMTSVLGLALLTVVMLLLSAIDAHGRGYLRPFSFLELYRFLLIWLPNGGGVRPNATYEPPMSVIFGHGAYVLIDLFFLAALIRGRRKILEKLRAQPDHPALLVLMTLWLPLIFTMAASTAIPKFYIERNLLSLITPYLLCLALGASNRWWRAGVLLSSAASLICIWTVRADQWTVYKPNPDSRSAAAVIRKIRLKNPGKPTLVFEFTGGPDTLVYYDKGAQIRQMTDLANPNEERLIYYPIHNLEEYAGVENVLKHYSPQTFIVAAEDTRHTRDVMEKFQSNSRFHQVDRWEFRKISVYQYSLDSELP